MGIKLLERIRYFLKRGPLIIVKYGWITFLVILLVILFFFCKKAFAQSGQCPSVLLFGLPLTTPSGTYPNDAKLCYPVQDLQVDWSVKNDPGDWFPCDQYVEYNPYNIGTVLRRGVNIYLVPPLDVSLDMYVRIRMIYIPHTNPFGPAQQSDYTISFNYYDENLDLINSVNDIPLTNYSYQDDYYINGFTTYRYRAYYVDQMILTEPYASNGIVEIWFNNNFQPDSPGTWIMDTGRVSSIQIGRQSTHEFPQHCALPHTTTYPPTATPENTVTPQPTPTGVYTPTATLPPITPYSTSVGSTPTAVNYPTPTAWKFPTTKPENTPTPWPPYNLPTVAWPTMPPVIVMAAATITNTTGGLGSLGSGINSDWAGNLGTIGGSLDTSLTTTTGISAPVAMINAITNTLGLPISYAKAVPDYLPNTSPFIAFMFVLFALIFFTVFSKTMIQVVVFVFNLLRHLWGLLPFT